MATPIGDTPELVGKDAEDFLNGLNKPLSKRKRRILKEMKEQRYVPL